MGDSDVWDTWITAMIDPHRVWTLACVPSHYTVTRWPAPPSSAPVFVTVMRPSVLTRGACGRLRLPGRCHSLSAYCPHHPVAPRALRALLRRYWFDRSPVRWTRPGIAAPCTWPARLRKGPLSRALSVATERRANPYPTVADPPFLLRRSNRDGLVLGTRKESHPVPKRRRPACRLMAIQSGRLSRGRLNEW